MSDSFSNENDFSVPSLPGELLRKSANAVPETSASSFDVSMNYSSLFAKPSARPLKKSVILQEKTENEEIKLSIEKLKAKSKFFVKNSPKSTSETKQLGPERSSDENSNEFDTARFELYSSDEESDEEEESEERPQLEINPFDLGEANTGMRAITILPGHKRVVTSLAWSPKSLAIISGSADGTARLWDATTGECTKILSGHTGGVLSVSWSHDGTFVATGSRDKTVIIWDAVTGEKHKTIDGHNYPVKSIAWSPRKLVIATGSATDMMRLWDINTGECKKTFRARGTGALGVRCVGWSPDGCFIASGSDHKVSIWNASTGDNSATFTGDYASAKEMAWSPTGKTLALRNVRPTVAIWEVDSHRCISVLKHKAALYSITWSTDGSFIITGSKDRLLRVWSATTGECTVTFKQRTSSINSLAWAPNGFRIVSGRYDGNVVIWNALLGQCAFTADEDAVEWSPKNKDKTPQSWSDADGLLGSTEGLLLAWSPTGLTVHLDSDAIKACIQKPGTTKEISILEGHSVKITCVAWSPSPTSAMLLTGGNEGNVRIWDAEAGRCIAILPHGSALSSIAWSPSSLFIITACQDCSVRIWSTTTHECVAKLIKPDPSIDYFRPMVAWSAFGQTVAATFGSNEARVWDLSTVIDKYGQRLDPLFASFPLSPLTVNDRILVGVEEAKKNPRHGWPWFLNLKHEMLRFTLESNMGKHEKRMLSADELYCLDFLDDSTWENPLHRAVRCGDVASSLLNYLLSITPSEALHLRWAPSKYADERPTNKSLLMRALESESLDCITLILSVFTEFLTLPQPGSEDAREFVTMKDEHFSLWVFKGNNCPNVEIECRNHCADHIDISEICEVSEKYQDVFLDFVKTLRISPNYDFVRSRDLSLAPMGGMNRLLAASEDRSPGELVGFGRSMDATSSGHRTLRESKLYADFMKKITGEVAATDQGEHASFWTINRIKKVLAPMQVPFRKNERVAVSPGLIPLKNVAALEVDDDGDVRICPFLESVVNTSAKLQDYSVFENEVVQCLVDFKWYAYVRNKFRVDALLFALLSSSFILNALVFKRYAYAGAFLKVPGCGLLGIGIILTFYYLRLEALQILRAYHDGNKSVKLYILDGWNLLDFAFLLMLFATYLSQIIDMAFPRSPPEKQGWNVRTNSLAAASMPLLAFQSLFFLKAAKNSGALVRMTITIISNIKVFCVMLLLFIVTFASAFFLLFQPVDEATLGPVVFDGAYHELHKTLLAVFTLLLGDINLGDMYLASSPQLAVVLMVTFLFLTGVVLLNMLIAIMGDLYDEVQDKATAQATYAKARLILEFESRLSTREMIRNKQDWFPTWIQVLKRGTFERDGEEVSSWDGRVKAVVTPMLKSMGAMKVDMEKSRRSAALSLNEKFRELSAQTEKKLNLLEESTAYRLDKMEKMLENVLDLMHELSEENKKKNG